MLHHMYNTFVTLSPAEHGQPLLSGLCLPSWYYSLQKKNQIINWSNHFKSKLATFQSSMLSSQWKSFPADIMTALNSEWL